MEKFVWPAYIQFDDTEADLNEARRVWLNARGTMPDGGTTADFLEFMQVYASELEKKRNKSDRISRLA
ncbi:MAG TPA: hypothetical protein V6D22_00860 [Candidatus Obscuribacterales bacterium]